MKKPSSFVGGEEGGGSGGMGRSSVDGERVVEQRRTED